MALSSRGWDFNVAGKTFHIDSGNMTVNELYEYLKVQWGVSPYGQRLARIDGRWVKVEAPTPTQVSLTSAWTVL